MADGAIPTDSLPPLIQGLLRPEAYPHPVGPIRLLQTHISWIVLTGSTAYKIKKPVDFGFVDFTTLARRRHFCREEVRLNRRLSPGLYEGVVTITGSPETPRVAAALDPAETPGGSQAPDTGIECAVRMVEFPQQALLTAALERGAVTPEHLDALADRLARFHSEADRASPEGPFGTAAAVLEPVRANIDSLRVHADPGLAPRLDALEGWIQASHGRLRSRFDARLASGQVRECHGDLHLGNLLLLQGAIEVFDCLEFNPGLRWIDPISDLAFLVMDLEEKGERPLAFRLLNRWLDQTGDHAGMELWPWYLSYRALVRAKVAALAGDPAQVERYVRLAERIAEPAPQALVLCHGVSGSGKSHQSAQLLEELGAIRLRSDVERKRLFGLWGIGAAGGPELDPDDLYAPAVSERLFEALLPARASALLAAGFTVIVDATFLCGRYRRRMAAVARQTGVPLLILSFSAPWPLLLQRLRRRQVEGSDPSDADTAVLRQQWEHQDPLSEEERACSLAIPAWDEAAGEEAAGGPDVTAVAAWVHQRQELSRRREAD